MTRPPCLGKEEECYGALDAMKKGRKDASVHRGKHPTTLSPPSLPSLVVAAAWLETPVIRGGANIALAHRTFTPLPSLKSSNQSVSPKCHQS